MGLFWNFDTQDSDVKKNQCFGSSIALHKFHVLGRDQHGKDTKPLVREN